MEHKFEIAVGMIYLNVSLKYSRECKWKLGDGLLERNVC